MRCRHLNPEHPEENEILVEGLEREVVMVQLSDTHLPAADGRDPHPARQAAAHFAAYFQQRTPGGAVVAEIFAGLLDRARQAHPDLLALTGDILHFPSVAGLEWLRHRLAGTDYLYTLGNHDWFFPYQTWSDAGRQAHYPRFFGLTGGNPACQVRRVGGLRVVALDNSTYQVSPEQADFLRRQLATGDPCLLLLHIPLATPSLLPAVMARWNAPIVMGGEEGWTAETRAHWLVGEVQPGTRACLDLVRQAANLVGVLCGHIHFARADELRPGCFQYVARPGFEGGCRRLRLKPYR
ncbi:MAG: metallophosphoesterase [Candidatus Latescibacteria bacterium]|nr:metallophosphoesterase [Candidatus Latescibacterota bacterium]